MRALIVEDDFTSRTLLVKIINAFFEVDIAVNGEEAVQAYETALDAGKPYDLLLMDTMMPEMDGITALERMEELAGKEEFKKTKIIMITALSDPKTVIKSFHDGWASAYIVKPVERGQIYSELEKLGFITK
jgi:two-component system chemotaxis response regulator CheY